jgi:hypothetical protein
LTSADAPRLSSTDARRRQLETYLSAIARELQPYDVIRHAEGIGVWAMPTFVTGAGGRSVASAHALGLTGVPHAAGDVIRNRFM